MHIITRDFHLKGAIKGLLEQVELVPSSSETMWTTPLLMDVGQGARQITA